MKLIVDRFQIVQCVLVENDHVLQLLIVLQGAIQTAHDVLTIDFRDEENIEYFAITRNTVMSGLVSGAQLLANVDAATELLFDVRQRQLNVLQRLMQDEFDQFEQRPIVDAHVAGDVPREMNHGHERFARAQAIPFVAFDGSVVLCSGQWTDVPGNVIAPPDRLYPRDTPRIDEDEIARFLHETVDWHLSIVQIVEYRPPRTRDEVHAVLFTQCLHDAPIFVGHGKPFAIARTNIDVNRTEVIVLLMARRPRARHFHVQLYTVHT